MDLSKAFDTLDHNILIKKLQYYGVIGTPLNWFQSYLADRTQYVEVNNESSSLQTILIGVPQGSILGPLLFLIYMNDIPNASNLFTFIYADDTTLFSTIEYSIPSSASNYHQTINSNLSQVTDWLIANRLSLNVKTTTTKYMLFHSYQKDINQVTPQLMLNNDEIERVDSFNFLVLKSTST